MNYLANGKQNQQVNKNDCKYRLKTAQLIIDFQLALEQTGRKTDKYGRNQKASLLISNTKTFLSQH